MNMLCSQSVLELVIAFDVGIVPSALMEAFCSISSDDEEQLDTNPLIKSEGRRGLTLTHGS